MIGCGLVFIWWSCIMLSYHVLQIKRSQSWNVSGSQLYIFIFMLTVYQLQGSAQTSACHVPDASGCPVSWQHTCKPEP